MGRRPCCAKEGLNRGAWSAREDQLLTNYVNIHGVGKWRDLPQNAGLRRCGKSCRLRWLNYLRPDIKRGNITKAEEELILRLHRLLGNRWSLIAGRLPGRTDNEIKNYWNTILGKKFQCKTTQKDLNKSKDKKPEEVKEDTHPVIRTKAVRCTKVYLPQEENQLDKKTMEVSLDGKSPFSLTQPLDDSSNFLMDFNIGEHFVADALNSDFLQPFGDGVQGTDNATGGDDAGYNSYSFSNYPFTTNEMLEDSTNGAVFENVRGCDPLQCNSALDLKTLSSFLDS